LSWQRLRLRPEIPHEAWKSKTPLEGGFVRISSCSVKRVRSAYRLSLEEFRRYLRRGVGSCSSRPEIRAGGPRRCGRCIGPMSFRKACACWSSRCWQSSLCCGTVSLVQMLEKERFQTRSLIINSPANRQWLSLLRRSPLRMTLLRKHAKPRIRDPAIAVCNSPAERMNEPFRLSP
jgi:hypothetical protein